MAKKNKQKKFNPNPGTSKFDGGLLGYIGWGFLLAFGSALTLGIATPWIECGYYRWIARHTKMNGKQVVFDGRGGQLFGKNIAWLFLGIITLGIFCLWLPIKKQKWIMKHTYIEECATAWEAPKMPQMPPVPQFPQQYYYPCAQQYYYPCAPTYPQGGCCRFYR